MGYAVALCLGTKHVRIRTHILQLARVAGNHGLVKIILKDTVKSMPIFGWGMQGFEFIFLARNWDADQTRLRRSLGSFVADKYVGVH